ncbi:speriolin [Suncus etruscus]|uniref:speriolin n=1 Tax=Suncus etruscus TaxID=109475 RepID=UPI00210FF648|nr:speriolin [Suncus etruscus]
MSLLTNYEGLRHQIERLVRENEELKKLVRLIRENHQLKTAIKTQAGVLGISGFSNALGEPVTSSTPCQGNGVYLAPSPAAANDNILDDMGLMALTPLGDMLNSPQPDALNILLAGPASLPLTSPLDGSLGMPSTGTMTPSSPLAGHMMTPPGGTLPSPVPGPISVGSPLLNATVNPSLLTVGNLVLPEVPRLRLPESPGAPHASVPAGPTLVSKGPTQRGTTLPPTEQPQQNQELESLTVTFVGAPVQTSSPTPAGGTPGAMPAFYGTSDARTQSGVHSSQGTPASVPAVPAATVPTSAPMPASQGTPHYSPSSTTQNQNAPHTPAQPQPSPSTHTTPRVPCSPPRASSSPPSAQDPQSPRATESSRKSALDLDRKLSPRKFKTPDRGREPKQLAWERLVGEIAFQLDRRILSGIFPERVRLYGFTVSNIPEKIIQASLNPHDQKLDEELCQTLTQRYVSIMNRLQSLGYNGRVHPALTEQLVNAYGILRERPELAATEGGSYSLDFLQHVLVETVHPSMLTDALLLLSCLSQLAHDDGKPMFIW